MTLFKRSSARPEDIRLDEMRRLWARARDARSPAPLDERREHGVMRAVLACPHPASDVTYWLARRLYPLALANAAVVLLTVALLWHFSADAAAGLPEYLQAAMPDYGVLL